MGIAELADLVRAGLDADEAVIRRNLEPHGLSQGWPDYPTYDSPDIDAAGDYIERFEPPRLLADVAARRQLLDQVLSWEHHHWPNVSRCEATIPGVTTCTCGRDERVLAVLQTLAAPYQETT